jgi:hypothetical protein
MTRYNLFSHAAYPESVCAVAVDRPVPSFIRSPRWQYAGEMEDSREAECPIERRAAQEACAWRGQAPDRQLCDEAPEWLPERVLPTPAASELTSPLTPAPIISLASRRANHA